MSEFKPQQLLAPLGWCLGNQTTESFLQLLIKSLRLSIGLGMITR